MWFKVSFAIVSAFLICATVSIYGPSLTTMTCTATCAPFPCSDALVASPLHLSLSILWMPSLWAHVVLSPSLRVLVLVLLVLLHGFLDLQSLSRVSSAILVPDHRLNTQSHLVLNVPAIRRLFSVSSV